MGVGWGPVRAKPHPLVEERDRRTAADILAQELHRACGLLVFEVARPVGERVPRKLRHERVERDERAGRRHRRGLVADPNESPVASGDERLRETRLALVEPSRDAVAPRRAGTEGEEEAEPMTA